MKPTKRALTQGQLKEKLHYNPDDGVFTWIHSYANRKGKIAGWSNSYEGYRSIEMMGITYLSHRLAWLYVNGEWPKDQLDHINQNKSDNRIKNLREVTNSENQKNVSMRSSNVSGIMGIHTRSDNGKWSVRISDGGTRYTLGSFVDFFEACCARKSAEIKYGFHVNHGRVL